MKKASKHCDITIRIRETKLSTFSKTILESFGV